MTTHRFEISGPAGAIEARLDHPATATNQVAVICHPHPLYGGSMHDAVCDTAARGLLDAGFHVLRFNFRGVGASGGQHDEGQGEQDDLAACVAWLRSDPDLANASPHIWLVGYSFGASVCWHAAPKIEPGGLILIAPAVAAMSFSGDVVPAPAMGVIAGDADAFGPASRVRDWLGQLDGATRLEVIPGADHFFGGVHAELEQRISAMVAAPEP